MDLVRRELGGLEQEEKDCKAKVQNAHKVYDRLHTTRKTLQDEADEQLTMRPCKDLEKITSTFFAGDFVPTIRKLRRVRSTRDKARSIVKGAPDKLIVKKRAMREASEKRLADLKTMALAVRDELPDAMIEYIESSAERRKTATSNLKGEEAKERAVLKMYQGTGTELAKEKMDEAKDTVEKHKAHEVGIRMGDEEVKIKLEAIAPTLESVAALLEPESKIALGEELRKLVHEDDMAESLTAVIDAARKLGEKLAPPPPPEPEDIEEKKREKKRKRSPWYGLSSFLGFGRGAEDEASSSSSSSSDPVVI